MSVFRRLFANAVSKNSHFISNQLRFFFAVLVFFYSYDSHAARLVQLSGFAAYRVVKWDKVVICFSLASFSLSSCFASMKIFVQ